MSYVAFPAISLFVLLGATVFTFVKIRGIRNASEPNSPDQQALLASTKLWWRHHAWGAGLLFAATLAMAWFGATWLLFLFYTVSLGLLVYVLSSLARLGLGNRFVIGQACMFALPLLGQMAGFPGIGGNDIHLLDQGLIVPVFFLAPWPCS